MIVISGAYGRDYKSAKAVRKDFDEDKDFIVRTFGHKYEGRPCNKQDLKNAGETSVQIRFSQDRKVIVVKL